MEVSIIESETGKVAYIFPITLRIPNYIPSDEEHFSDAWQQALEDKEVDADSRDKYRFSLSQ